MENLEKNVLKKTNKYVYLSNGTHMSHSDFHRYKQDIRNELAIVHNNEYKDSIKVFISNLKEIETLNNRIASLKEERIDLENDLQFTRDYSNHDWEESFRRESTAHSATKDLLTEHARSLYKDLSSLPIIENFTNDKGIKFIIQKNHKTDEFRFCFDPYQLGSNFHSTLSMFYEEEYWGTVNGGWLKAIDNTIVLYKSSGDYGIYDDTIAIECAKKVFKNKKILSFSNTEWDKISY
jgi:hypothetical protein